MHLWFWQRNSTMVQGRRAMMAGIHWKSGRKCIRIPGKKSIDNHNGSWDEIQWRETWEAGLHSWKGKGQQWKLKLPIRILSVCSPQVLGSSLPSSQSCTSSHTRLLRTHNAPPSQTSSVSELQRETLRRPGINEKRSNRVDEINQSINRAISITNNQSIEKPIYHKYTTTTSQSMKYQTNNRRIPTNAYENQIFVNVQTRTTAKSKLSDFAKSINQSLIDVLNKPAVTVKSNKRV